MARVYGTLGAELKLIDELNKLEVYSLNSLSDVEKHLRDSDSILEAKKKAVREDIHREITDMKKLHSNLMGERTNQRLARRKLLTSELHELQDRMQDAIPETRNPIKWLLQTYRVWRNMRRLKRLENNFMEELDRPFRAFTKKIKNLEEKVKYLHDNSEAVMLKRLDSEIREKQSIDRSIKKVRTWLSGARGERDVAKILAELPDSYVVINDVNLQLIPPLRSEEGPRFYCQADHVVIGPSGVFNIETKNWSQQSIRRLDLRSPVQQIRLTGKALYRDINRAISNREIRIAHHHWGDKSVRVRNILAMVGAMPDTEFQYVKMVTLKRLKGYIEYFETAHDNDEVNGVADWILQNSE
jgi:hypothetical protein